MHDALSHAYRLYYPLLVRKCSRMLRDPHEAEDLAQIAFTRLSQSALPLDDERVVSAWLYRTSTRLALDRLRRRGREHADPLLLELLASAPEQETTSLARRMLHALGQSLPGSALEAAVLVCIDGLTQQETAEVMGVSARTVRRWLVSFDACAAQLREWSES